MLESYHRGETIYVKYDAKGSMSVPHGLPRKYLESLYSFCSPECVFILNLAGAEGHFRLQPISRSRSRSTTRHKVVCLDLVREGEKVAVGICAKKKTVPTALFDSPKHTPCRVDCCSGRDDARDGQTYAKIVLLPCLALLGLVCCGM